MKRTYYLFNPGRLSRKDNTLKFTPVDEEGREGQVRYIPIETVDNLFVYGSLDANSALYNFLEKIKLQYIFSIITSIIQVHLCLKSTCYRGECRLLK